MFKFNFQNEGVNVKKVIEDEANASAAGNKGCESKLWRPLHKLEINKVHFQDLQNITCNHVQTADWKPGFQLKYLRSDELDQSIIDVSQSRQCHHSDLIPTVYEGGFKIWECTWELLKFFDQKDIIFANKRVLELGCGAGLLGIAAAIEKASLVAFQDYNEEVLARLTIPNLLLNLSTVAPQISTSPSVDATSTLNSKVHFYSGDWGFLPQGILESGNNLFDIILTSETIYNVQNYSKLIKVFEECLKPDGEIFLSSKTHYFGVGGGTHDFVSCLPKVKFEVESVVCQGTGVQKEILRIRKHQI